VTNRPTGQQSQAALQDWAKKEYSVDLTICEQRWPVMQLHRRDNLDLLGQYLHLPPPRPRFFLDLCEFEELLKERRLLKVPFEGRREELDELERLLGEERQAVVIEAHGGFGKTRLAVELARSGRSATPWFFIPDGMPFKADYQAGHFPGRAARGECPQRARAGLTVVGATLAYGTLGLVANDRDVRADLGLDGMVGAGRPDGAGAWGRGAAGWPLRPPVSHLGGRRLPGWRLGRRHPRARPDPCPAGRRPGPGRGGGRLRRLAGLLRPPRRPGHRPGRRRPGRR